MTATTEAPTRGRDATTAGACPTPPDLLDYLPQMVWIVDDFGGALRFANQRFYDLVGDDIAHRTDRLHADDRIAVLDHFAGAKRDGGAREFECRIRRNDGTYRWHAMFVKPLRETEGHPGLIVTALDIEDSVAGRSRLEETTDLLHIAQNAAGVGTWDFDLRSGKLWMSRESARLHNLGDGDLVTDIETWQGIVNPADAAVTLAKINQAVESRTFFAEAHRVMVADGEPRWVSAVGRAYYDAAGTPTRMIGLNFDVTEQKNAENALIAAKGLAEQARLEAEHASMAKSEFLASMSHEIRTPLNSIIGYADLLLEDGCHDGATRHRLEVIQDAGASLLTVVNDILDFSKIEAGQVSLEARSFSPQALLVNVASMLGTQAQRKSLAIEVHVADDVPAALLGDGDRLRQIVLNLANNAVKFTERGLVKLGVERAAPASGHLAPLRFFVEDSGIGIAPDKQVHLFQRFSQVDGSITRRFGGTGLGLAICKSLVELMGGTIGMRSVEGRGSTFWFDIALPLAAPLERRPAGDPGPRPAVAAARILLVEDVAVNRDLGVAVLTNAGHLVDTAPHGGIAVAMVQSSTYDIVLMDVQMPVMDGIAATREIRALPGGIGKLPIVAMTANVLPQQIAALREAGMDDHVGKPFKAPDLLATIARWTGKDEERAPSMNETEQQVDEAAFASMQNLVGDAAFRSIVAKFRTELSSRFADLGAAADPQRTAADAHALIPSAGLLGFKRLTAICRTLEDTSASGGQRQAALADFAEERRAVIAWLGAR